MERKSVGKGRKGCRESNEKEEEKRRNRKQTSFGQCTLYRRGNVSYQRKLTKRERGEREEQRQFDVVHC